MTAMLLHKGCRKPVYIGVTPEDVAVGQMRLAGRPLWRHTSTGTIIITEPLFKTVCRPFASPLLDIGATWAS